MNGEQDESKMANEAYAQIAHLAELDRHGLIEQLLHFPGTFKLDFTPEYLDGLSDEQLQHVLLAAYLHAYKAEESVPK